MSKELKAQWKNAFSFVRKFYFETSYLIKEVEGLLGQEAENFTICRPSGYGATIYSSTGLETRNVESWFPRTATVAFVPDSSTTLKAGQTITKYSSGLMPLFLHVDLFSEDCDEPMIYAGCLKQIVAKKDALKKKMESLLFEFAYNPDKILANVPKIAFEDSYCKLTGTAKEIPLFSINNSEDVSRKIVEPMVKLYRRSEHQVAETQS